MSTKHRGRPPALYGKALRQCSTPEETAAEVFTSVAAMQYAHRTPAQLVRERLFRMRRCGDYVAASIGSIALDHYYASIAPYTSLQAWLLANSEECAAYRRSCAARGALREFNEALHDYRRRYFKHLANEIRAGAYSAKSQPATEKG